MQRSYIVILLVIAAVLQDPRLLDPFHHSRFVFSSVALLVFTVVFARNYRGKDMEVQALDLAIPAFMVWNFVSITWGINFSEAIFASQKWVVLTAGYFGGRLVIRSADEHFYRDLSKYSMWTTVFVLAITWWNLVQLSVEQGYGNETLYDLKVLFGHRSLTAAFLVLLLPLNLISLSKIKTLIAPLPFLIGLQILTILLLQSRTVYLALFAGLAITLVYLVRNREKWWERKLVNQSMVMGILLVVLAGAYLSANEQVRERLNPVNYFTSQTATERRLIWIKTREMISERPLLGYGSGNWKLELPGYGTEGSYRMQDQAVVFTRVHNDFLEVWAELGFIGLLIYMLIFLLPLYYLYRSDGEPWKRLMIGTGIISFVIISLIDFPKERTEFLWLLSLYLAMSTSFVKEPGRHLPGALTTPLLVALSLALCFNIYTGWFRYQGELRTKKLFHVRKVENWHQVVQLAEQASNPWYRLDPSTVPLEFYKGIAHYNLGEIDRAREAFNIARSYHPYNFHVINNQATILIQEKKYREAIPLLEEAVRINDRFTDALFNLAYCYFHLEEYEQALSVIEEIPGKSKKKEAYRKQILEAMDEADR